MNIQYFSIFQPWIRVNIKNDLTLQGGSNWTNNAVASTASPYVSAWTVDVAQDKVGPSNASWYSSQGMGQVYTYKNGLDQGITVFLRGAYWSSGSDAGAFSLRLVWGAGSTSYSVGFRCAR